MNVEQILRQMSLLVVLLMLDTEGILRLTEGKAFQKSAYHDHKEGTHPTFVRSPENKTVREGRGLSLVCEATGKPKPRIKWKKDGQSILLSTDRITTRNKRNNKLRIKNAMPQDSGTYHCVAKNRHGSSSSYKAVVKVVSDGTCKSYSGSVCSRYIPRDTKVFVQQHRPQQQSEQKIIAVVSTLTDYTITACKDSLLKALCYNLFPPCQSGKNKRIPRRLCKDGCDILLGSTCSREMRLLERRLGYLVGETVPNCSLLPFQGEPEAKNCLPIKNKEGSCQESNDPFQVVIKPLKGTFPLCNRRLSKSVKIHKDVFKLVKYVKSELQNGNMVLDSQSMELSTYCFSASLPLNKLVSEWTTYFRTPLLPNFPLLYNMTVPGLKISTLNSSVNTIWVPLGHAPKYSVHRNILLRNVTFYYRYQSGHGSFIADGKYDICGAVFNVTVETLPDGITKLSGNSETPLDLDTIETAFVSVSSSYMLGDAIKNIELFELRLMRPSMETYISKDLIVKFSGKSYIGDRALPVTLEIFAGKWRRRDVLLAGITGTLITINQALNWLTSFPIPYLDILKHSRNGSSVGITLASLALDLSATPYKGFEEEPLALAFEDTVPEGLSLVTRGSIPVETHSEIQVCQLFQTVFGRGSEFTLKASTNRAAISLDWHFHKLSKRTVSPFDRVNMKMKINDTTKKKPLPFMDIPVDGTLYKNGQRFEGLAFSGKVTYRGLTSNLEANFETTSIWRRAFGIEYLTMKNLRLGLSLPTDQSQKSSTTGQAELQLGSLCNTAGNRENDSFKQSCVTGHLSLGFSDESADHFFYGSLSPVSLQKLLEVCNINLKLPGALATIGFPEGLQISVARGAHDLSALGGPTIEPGFILAGKMSVLGIETTGAISLLPKEFLIDAKIVSEEYSVTLDGATPLSSSTSDSSDNSPKLFLQARMDPVPFVKAHVDGYARLIGIFREVRMLVTSDSLQIYLTTDVNKSFKIDVHVITNYSSNLNETQFNAEVVFDNGLSKLTRLAANHVVSMLESEMSRLKSAKGEVQRLRRDCVKTMKRECSSCVSHGVCAGSLPSTSLKKPTNTSEKKRETQRASLTTDICQQVVMERCLAAESAYHNVCRFISSTLNKTCAAYDTAARSHRELERGLRWVKEAYPLMYDDMFKLHAISFKTNVTSANLEQIYLDTALELTIFGQKQKIEDLRMDFNEFVKLSSEIAKYAVDWYQETQSKSKPRHPDNRPRPPAS